MSRTKNAWMVGLSMAGLMLASTGTALAQDGVTPAEVTKPIEAVATENLPDGFELFEKHIEAVGGQKAVDKIQAIRMNATFKMPAVGMTGDLLIQLKAPSLLAVVVELPGMGNIIQGADGEQAWASLGPGAPAMIVEGPQAEALIDQARFRDEYTPRKAYESAKTIGKELFNDEMVYTVELVKKDSEITTLGLFSVASGLRVAEKSKSDQDSDTYDLVTAMSDYRKVDDLVLFAHKLTVKTAQFDQIIEMNKIEINPEFEAGTFDAPGSF